MKFSHIELKSIF